MTPDEWLAKAWADRVCVGCSSAAWTSGPIVELRGYGGADLALGGGTAVVPLLPVVCLGCGQTALVNTAIAGIIIPTTE